MDSKEQIEAMARKYKEEMLRMYKNNIQSSKANVGKAESISPPQAAQPKIPSQSVQAKDPAENVRTVQPPHTEKQAESVNPIKLTQHTLEIQPKNEQSREYTENVVQEKPKFPPPEELMNDESENFAETEETGAAKQYDQPNFQGNYNSEEFSDLSDPLEPRYSGGEDETSDEDGIGFIKAEVTTGSGAVPIENAVVLITKKENGKTYLLKMLISDESGSTETVALPAPNVSFSETPDPTEKPFADYYISAYADGFYAENDMEVPVFSDVKSIQPIALIPRCSADGRAILG